MVLYAWADESSHNNHNISDEMIKDHQVNALLVTPACIRACYSSFLRVQVHEQRGALLCKGHSSVSFRHCSIAVSQRSPLELPSAVASIDPLRFYCPRRGPLSITTKNVPVFWFRLAASNIKENIYTAWLQHTTSVICDWMLRKTDTASFLLERCLNCGSLLLCATYVVLGTVMA